MTSFDGKLDSNIPAKVQALVKMLLSSYWSKTSNNYEYNIPPLK